MTNSEVNGNLELEHFEKLLLERFSVLQRQAMAEGTILRTEAERQRINFALERIRKEDYWYCIKCKEEIAVERLLADPATLVCSDCEPHKK